MNRKKCRVNDHLKFNEQPTNTEIRENANEDRLWEKKSKRWTMKKNSSGYEMGMLGNKKPKASLSVHITE